MKVFFVFVGILAVATSADYSKKQPNFIYILSDDLGHADVGFTAGKVRTPVLDRLAKEGMFRVCC